ncbi:hypothetical protein ACRS5S_33900 [Nocardia asiatica]|uniref:hypothetical protein n=1 Tax=Nocardia asiatica TaxID=209252 RepID=UPI002455C3E3|nr:hypothetical protein [Nocardia asiatica]
MIDPDIDPEVETQLRAFMASATDLSTATIQLENVSLDDIVRPIQVEENFMTWLASAPDASPQLRQYAAQVNAGYCTWPEIEKHLGPDLPPEVVALKSSPHYVWPWAASEPDPPATMAPSAPPASPPPPRPDQPTQSPGRRRVREPDTVGPSDWPDDFDDHPSTQRSWLA